MTKKWKAYLVDESIIAAFDKSTKKSRMLSDYQCALLLSQCKQLYWSSRYLNLSIPLDEIAAIVSDLEHELMIEGAAMDCSAIEECDIIIDISNQITLFDDISISIVNISRVNNYNLAAQNIFIYNQNTPPVYMTSSNQDSINRFCLVMDVWLGAWKAKFLNYAAIQTGAAIAGATVSGYLAGVTGALGIPFVAVPFGLLSGWYAYQVGVIEDYIAAYNDAIAYEDVLCALKDAFSNAGVSYSAFIAALATLPSRVTGDNQELLADHVVTMLSHTESYLYLIELMILIQDYTPTGDDCTCVETLPACLPYGSNGQIPSSDGFPVPSPYMSYSSDVTFTTQGSVLNSAVLKYGSSFEIMLDNAACIRYMSFSARHEGSGAGLNLITAKVYLDGVYSKDVSFYWGTNNTSNPACTIDLLPSGEGIRRVKTVRIEINPSSSTIYGYITKVWKVRVVG